MDKQRYAVEFQFRESINVYRVSPRFSIMNSHVVFARDECALGNAQINRFQS